jgi:hypothetical protein
MDVEVTTLGVWRRAPRTRGGARSGTAGESFSADGYLLAVGHASGSLRVWETLSWSSQAWRMRCAEDVREKKAADATDPSTAGGDEVVAPSGGRGEESEQWAAKAVRLLREWWLRSLASHGSRSVQSLAWSPRSLPPTRASEGENMLTCSTVGGTSFSTLSFGFSPDDDDVSGAGGKFLDPSFPLSLAAFSSALSLSRSSRDRSRRADLGVAGCPGCAVVVVPAVGVPVEPAVTTRVLHHPFFPAVVGEEVDRRVGRQIGHVLDAVLDDIHVDVFVNQDHHLEHLAISVLTCVSLISR